MANGYAKYSGLAGSGGGGGGGVNGPGSSTVGDAVIWNNTLGTLVADAGAPPVLTTGSTMSGTLAFSAFGVSLPQGALTTLEGNTANVWFSGDRGTGLMADYSQTVAIGTTATFSSGASSITVSAATNLFVGQIISATGLQANTAITSITGTTIGISLPTTSPQTNTALSQAFGSVAILSQGQQMMRWSQQFYSSTTSGLAFGLITALASSFYPDSALFASTSSNFPGMSIGIPPNGSSFSNHYYPVGTDRQFGNAWIDKIWMASLNNSQVNNQVRQNTIMWDSAGAFGIGADAANLNEIFGSNSNLGGLFSFKITTNLAAATPWVTEWLSGDLVGGGSNTIPVGNLVIRGGINGTTGGGSPVGNGGGVASGNVTIMPGKGNASPGGPGVLALANNSGTSVLTVGATSTLPALPGGTNWATLSLDGSKNVVATTPGASGTVWTSNGTSAAPTWQAASGGAITTVPGSVTQNNAVSWGAANSALQDTGMTLTTALLQITASGTGALTAFTIKGQTNTSGGSGGNIVLQQGTGSNPTPTVNDGLIVFRDRSGNDNIKIDSGNGVITMLNQASAVNPVLSFPNVGGGFGSNAANYLFVGTSNTIRFNPGSSTNTLQHISDNNGDSSSIGIQGALASTTISPFHYGFFGTGGVFAGQASGTVGSTYSPSAIMGAVSTTKGFLPPVMTTTQKNAVSSPAEGLIVYDVTLHKLSVFTGTIWETVTSV